jgi:CheY-like chemotaxis protein
MQENLERNPRLRDAGHRHYNGEEPKGMSKQVLAVVTDMFFAAKINEAAARTGAAVKYARSRMQGLELARTERPSLIVIDLNAAGAEPLQLLAQLKAEAGLREIPTLGFISHVQTELQEQARQAGCDRVLARSAFSRDLPAILS